MASAFAVSQILTFALKTSTCGVRLAKYIPKFQEYPAGCGDLIERYFNRGLEYRDFVVSCIQSWNQLKS